MDNIEISVKVNGEDVPLSSISTETFEKIKVVEKTKKIPPVRFAIYERYDGNKKIDRILLKVSEDIAHYKNQVVAIDVKTGNVYNHWESEDESKHLYLYTDIKTEIE